ncbi:MAG: hypothetical protein NXI27_18790 [Alphaproteobacteria bacterium]|nr:hypothetical protein [Alphaproteobacteria bacterium]
MSNQEPQKASSSETAGWIEPGRQNAQLVYILYLVSLAVGLTALVGLVFAYMNRGNSEDWIDSHYTYAIRTFWIGVLYSFICLILAFVGIGFLLMFVALVWFVIRCIKGLQAITRNEPISNVETWLI